MDIIIKAVDVEGRGWTRWTFGMRAHPREIPAFIRWMVSGWKSLRGRMVEIIIFDEGKVCVAL